MLWLQVRVVIYERTRLNEDPSHVKATFDLNGMSQGQSVISARLPLALAGAVLKLINGADHASCSDSASGYITVKNIHGLRSAAVPGKP